MSKTLVMRILLIVRNAILITACLGLMYAFAEWVVYGTIR